tara:strand:- start:1306 stop:3429 length:2124 start_codon:yes stop_codon:yes gene_type:complete
MAQWRKVLVSGSAADVSSLNVGTAEGTAGTIINNSSIAGSRITGSFTGSFVGDGTNLTGITATSLDIDAFGSDLTSATLAVSDLILVSDGGTDGRANIGDLATPLAGTGLEANSNTVRIATAAAGTGLTGGGGSALSVDLNGVGAAVLAQGADSIVFIDADDNSTKKETVADFVDAINGTGLDAGSGQLSVTAAQTGITSVKNNALVVGGNSQNNTIDFGTDDVILFDIDNTEVARVDAAGVDITGALTTTGNITVAGAVSASAGMTGSFTGSFVGDGSNLTGVSFQIDGLSNTLTAVAQADLVVVADADASNEEKKITFSNFEDQIFSNINSESSEIDVAAGGRFTIADNAVSLAKLAGITRGSIIVGDASGDPAALDVNDDGKILVGDGNDINSVAVSGDVTLANTGAVTIANDAVSNAKLANMTQGTIKVGGGSNAPTDLDAKTDGQILVGDGTDINSVAVSGDVTLANNGAVTIAADAVEGTMLNTNSADGSTMELSSDSLSVLKVPNALTLSTGLTAGGTFDGAAARTVTVASAQTGIQTIFNTSLVVGRASNDTTIDFTTDDQIVFDVGSTEALKIDTTGLTVAGNLTVNGSTTTISSTNLLVKDPFVFAASGSAGANVDGGLIVQEGSAEGTGSAFYHDTTDNRWAVAKSVEQKATAVTALEHVVTVKQLGDNDAPLEGDKEYGAGEMAINNDGSIWIYS